MSTRVWWPRCGGLETASSDVDHRKVFHKTAGSYCLPPHLLSCLIDSHTWPFVLAPCCLLRHAGANVCQMLKQMRTPCLTSSQSSFSIHFTLCGHTSTCVAREEQHEDRNSSQEQGKNYSFSWPSCH